MGTIKMKFPKENKNWKKELISNGFPNEETIENETLKSPN